MSSRPACASVVELLCEAGACPKQEGYSHADAHLAIRDETYCIASASKYGAVETARVLLRFGAKVNHIRVGSPKHSALHEAVTANRWSLYRDPWSREQARQNAASLGHQGLVRLLLKHGAAVNAFSPSTRMTPLMRAARFSGFISLGVVKELLSCGADLDLVNADGTNAEAIARARLSFEVYTGEGIPEWENCRRPGAVEAFLALLAEVRAAGSWKRYVNKPRIDVTVLQRLCAAGRASPPPALARLFPTSTKSPPLPREMVWHILSFWRTDRDP